MYNRKKKQYLHRLYEAWLLCFCVCVVSNTLAWASSFFSFDDARRVRGPKKKSNNSIHVRNATSISTSRWSFFFFCCFSCLVRIHRLIFSSNVLLLCVLSSYYYCFCFLKLFFEVNASSFFPLFFSHFVSFHTIKTHSFVSSWLSASCWGVRTAHASGQSRGDA